MTALAQTVHGLARVRAGEWLLALAWAVGLFAALGTLTALWDNPLFIRMTPVGPPDYLILAAEAGLLGLFVSLRTPACPIKGAAFGGVLGFQGFACSICNKLLLLAFGSGALLQWYDPYRYWIGLAGIAVLWLVVSLRLRARAGG